MSSVNWKGVFIYAVVITAIIVAIVGFSEEPVASAPSDTQQQEQQEQEVVSSSNVNASRFNVNIGPSGIVPDSHEIEFMTLSTFVFRNDFDEDVRVDFTGLDRSVVVPALKFANISLLAYKTGTYEVEFYRDGVLFDAAEMVVSSSYADNPRYAGLVYVVPSQYVPTSYEVSVGDGVGLMLESADGQDHVFSSDLGSVVAVESPEEFTFFVFTEPGEVVFSTESLDTDIRFIVTE